MPLQIPSVSCGEQARPAAAHGARLLAVAWLTLFVIGTDLFVPSPLLPAISAQFGVDVATAGWIVSAFSLAYMIGAPLMGHIADRWDRRRMVIAGLAVFAAANALSAAASGFAMLVAVRVVAGLAACAVTPSIYAMVGSLAPADGRASWLAITVSGLLCALSAGTPLAALVAAAHGWRVVFAALGCLSLAVALPNWLVWPAMREPGPVSARGARSPALARRLLLTVMWATALYGVYTYLGAGLVAAGADAATVAQVVVCYGLGALAGTFAGGRLADRLGSRVAVTISLSGLAVSLFALSLMMSRGLLPAAVSAPAFGFVSALAQLFFPAQQAALARDFPERRAAALAWNNSALFLGISLGAALGGAILDRAGYAAVLGAGAVIGLGGALLVPVLAGRRVSERTVIEPSQDRSMKIS
ncbi:MAG TPA: MFS transporter [Stellaceae bacterium]|nr:MFS transporter [Stellaceae bacterium]